MHNCKGLILYTFLLTTGTQSLTRWYCCRYGNEVKGPAYVTPNKCPIIGALGVQIKVNEFCYMPPFEVAWCNLIKVKKVKEIEGVIIGKCPCNSK
jgi:hypothetical protein